MESSRYPGCPLDPASGWPFAFEAPPAGSHAPPPRRIKLSARGADHRSAALRAAVKVAAARWIQALEAIREARGNAMVAIVAVADDPALTEPIRVTDAIALARGEARMAGSWIDDPTLPPDPILDAAVTLSGKVLERINGTDGRETEE